MLRHGGAHDLRVRIANGHLSVSHVSSSIMLLDRDIEMHIWLCDGLLYIYMYVLEKDLKSGLDTWHASCRTGVLSPKILTT